MPLQIPVIQIDSPEEVEKSSNGNSSPTESRVSFYLPATDDNSSTYSSTPPLAKRILQQSRGSIVESTVRLKKRASQLVIEIPAAQLRKIKETEGIGSVKRESKHFCDTTTLHGPKRVFYGKKFSCFFWLVIMFGLLIFLLLQIGTLSSMYFSHPTLSQVSFLIKEQGIAFPVVTFCNFNPVKKTYIKQINKTGDFSEELLEYLMEYIQDANTLYGSADRQNLHVGQKALEAYQKAHPEFDALEFFTEAGFECEELMKLCSIGGRQFSCCSYTHPTLTNLGMCYSLDVQQLGKEWMKKQVETGVASGLEMVLDTHLEEQFDGTGGEPEPVFTDAFENGFRYYVHAPETISYLVSEGISVSPATRVYSAITTNSYVLLPREKWGNCTSEWPSQLKCDLPYSAVNCDSKCKAHYFYSECGCSPFTYNIDNEYPMCSPFDTVRCIDEHIRPTSDGGDNYKIPKCKVCQVECQSIVYHAYNSYGQGFSNSALAWLQKKNSSWSKSHMRSNFLTINIFFRDMSYTEYVQVQGTSLTETLSDIGGNMGMFFGMSLITLVEVILYLSKVGWITISKKRRDYMYQKETKEKEHEKQLEETVSGFRLFRNHKVGTVENGAVAAKLQALAEEKENSFPKSDSDLASCRENEASERRSQFMDTNAGVCFFFNLIRVGKPTIL
ncbi:hypothetical protein V3C99_005178 [Haemonchus contortus]